MFDWEEIRRAKEEGERNGKLSIEHVLARLKMSGEREALEAKAQELGYGFADLNRVRTDAEAKRLIAGRFAWVHQVLPLRFAGGTLWVAMGSPNMEIVQAVRNATGLRVVPVLALPADLSQAIASAYPTDKADP